MTSVPSGYVLFETAGVGVVLLGQLKLNLSTADPVPAGKVIVGRHRRGNDKNFGLQEGSAFFGFFDFGLPHCPARRVRSGDRHSVASMGWLAPCW